MTDIEQYSEKIFEDIKHYTEDGVRKKLIGNT